MVNLKWTLYKLRQKDKLCSLWLLPVYLHIYMKNKEEIYTYNVTASIYSQAWVWQTGLHGDR